PSACDQRLSLRPSQNSHGLYPAAAMGIVRLEPTPIPSPTFLPSCNCRSGSWQVLQATAWLRLKRGSKNSRLPRAAAATESSQAFDGSSGTPGSSLSRSDASTANSWLVHPPLTPVAGVAACTLPPQLVPSTASAALSTRIVRSWCMASDPFALGQLDHLVEGDRIRAPLRRVDL